MCELTISVIRTLVHYIDHDTMTGKARDTPYRRSKEVTADLFLSASGTVRRDPRRYVSSPIRLEHQFDGMLETKTLALVHSFCLYQSQHCNAQIWVCLTKHTSMQMDSLCSLVHPAFAKPMTNSR